jgi:hypothetical protein
MTNAQNFMIAARNANDTELNGLMRTSMMNMPGPDRLGWLKQIELGLDGYGGPRHMSAVERIANILQSLERELRGDSSLVAG